MIMLAFFLALFSWDLTAVSALTWRGMFSRMPGLIRPR